MENVRHHPPAARPVAWLRGAEFDGTLVLGGFSLALLTGIVIVLEPALFSPRHAAQDEDHR